MVAGIEPTTLILGGIWGGGYPRVATETPRHANLELGEIMEPIPLLDRLRIVESNLNRRRRARRFNRTSADQRSSHSIAHAGDQSLAQQQRRVLTLLPERPKRSLPAQRATAIRDN